MRLLISQFSARGLALIQNGAGSRIVSGFMLVALLTVVTKGVSFLKDAAVARQFGTGDALDAFLVAFGLLTFLASLMGGGLPESFLPAYTQIAHLKNRRRAARLAVQASCLQVLSLLGIVIGCYYVAPSFINAVTRGFSPAKQALAVGLLRDLLPFMMCYGTAYLLSAWLRADKRFVIATSAPVLVPLSIIGLLLWQGNAATVTTLVTGTVAGAALHLAVLLAAVAWRLPRQKRFWWRCAHLWEPRLAQMGRNAVQFLFAGAIFSSTVIVDQTMAAWLASGSVAVLGYTEKICGIVLAVTVVPSSDVLFPYFADKVARQDWLGVQRQLFSSAGAILALALPAALMLSWLAPWVVHLLFERGSFTSQDTERVAEVLRYAALQIPFYILGSLASRVVVAMQATQFIMWMSLLGLVGNVGLNWLLMRSMGAAGIALSTVLISMATAALACLYVVRQIRHKLADG